MKLNYAAIKKIPNFQTQMSIIHDADNPRIRETFPECFTKDAGESLSVQIPWSLINSKGYIGKFAFDIEDGFNITNYLDSIDVPYMEFIEPEEVGYSSSGRPQIGIPADDPFWYSWDYISAEHEDWRAVGNKNFRPFMREIEGRLYLIVGYLLHNYAYGVPASIIDFSK